jgi:methionyl-tRNA formyltransferase
MEMDEKLDSGPIIAQIKQKISINDNVSNLTKKLTKKAITLLKYNLPQYINFKQNNKIPKSQPKNYTLHLPPQPQDHALANFTPSYKSRTHSTAFISYQQIKAAIKGQKANTIHALIRSLNPEPGAWTQINKTKLKIIQTSLQHQQLKINKVQIPGKTILSWQQFTNGHKLNL